MERESRMGIKLAYSTITTLFTIEFVSRGPRGNEEIKLTKDIRQRIITAVSILPFGLYSKHLFHDHTSKPNQVNPRSIRRKFDSVGDCIHSTISKRSTACLLKENVHPKPKPARVPTFVCKADSPPCGPPPTPPM